ncbi:hypothetical protein [Candidatus Enterovibrio altilux]|uniref:Mobile element protein n=1 Tax=Candidatus Enterovibrio altilux TaxID=1927128 RepID=A0A291B8V1_9GAMM|nr:hypothetical protein BTN50_0933 [Candidatus Enterovibrio luxaltus]
MVKCIFSMPLSCPHDSYMSKRAKTVNATLKTKNKSSIQYLPLIPRGLKSTVKTNDK